MSARISASNTNYIGPEAAAGEFVVAIDFGTTFSGHAFVRTSDPQPTISRFFDWPGVNDYPGRHYCKTITALYYEGDDEQGLYQLKAWGWPALDKFTEEMKLAKRYRVPGFEIRSSHSGVTSFRLAERGIARSRRQGGLAGFSGGFRAAADEPASAVGGAKYGCYLTQFKLDLIKPLSNRAQLPGDLNTERLIVDYLKSMVDFIMEKLRLGYDNSLRTENVEWCVTVPSIWDVQAKQTMIACAAKAGLGNVVQERMMRSSNLQPVPRRLDIILEPEGASVYCQFQLSKGLLLKKGDKLMIADVGGGTIDLVVHSKAEDDPRSTKVDEEVCSYGELGGGTFVDAGFFRLLSEKVGPRFAEICRREPGTRLKILEWWQGVKRGFNGNYYSASLEVGNTSQGLQAAWREQQQQLAAAGAHVLSTTHIDDIELDQEEEELWLEDDDFRCIFDPEVDKVLKLIDMQVWRGVKVLMVVGGFSTSPYLRHQVYQRFKDKVSQILFPEELGSAISYGAVQLHLHNSIQSRIAQRTYGIEHIRKMEEGDPKELVFKDVKTGSLMCNKVFYVFVKKGQRIPCGHAVTQDCKPGHGDQKHMQLDLYSSEELDPKFTTSCRHEGGFEFEIIQGLKQKKESKIEVRMVFGASTLQVTAMPKNSSSKSNIPSNVVTFIAPLEW